jgi:hypothetical protein
VSVDTGPPPAALVARARELWECLAGEAAGFASAMSVAVSRDSGLGPAGWAGLVVLDGAVLATAPDYDTARVIEQALGGLPAASLGDTGVLASRLPAAEVIGRNGGHGLRRPGASPAHWDSVSSASRCASGPRSVRKAGSASCAVQRPVSWRLGVCMPGTERRRS